MGATVSTRKRLTKLYELAIKERQAALDDKITTTSEIVAFIRPKIKKLAIGKHMLEPLVDFFLESVLPDNQNRLQHDRPEQHNFFALMEVHQLHYAGAPLLKARGDFTLFDLDQATRQKRQNLEMVSLALRKWEWEVSYIRPLLVANPHWLYRDALKHLEEHDGIPKPPSFKGRPRKSA